VPGPRTRRTPDRQRVASAAARSPAGDECRTCLFETVEMTRRRPTRL